MDLLVIAVATCRKVRVVKILMFTGQEHAAALRLGPDFGRIEQFGRGLAFCTFEIVQDQQGRCLRQLMRHLEGSAQCFLQYGSDAIDRQPAQVADVQIGKIHPHRTIEPPSGQLPAGSLCRQFRLTLPGNAHNGNAPGSWISALPGRESRFDDFELAVTTEKASVDGRGKVVDLVLVLH